MAKKKTSKKSSGGGSKKSGSKKSKAKGAPKGKKGSGKKSGKTPPPESGIFTYRGVKLSKSLSDKIKALRRDLAWKGCFYTYDQVITMLFNHIRFYLLWRKNPEAKYPCDKIFLKVATGYFQILEDEYFHNTGISVIENFRAEYGEEIIMYFRSVQGRLVRYKNYTEFHERVTTEYSIVWKAVWDWIEDTEEVESPIIEIHIGREPSTGIIFIDFHRESSIAGVPLDPVLTPYVQKYYEEAGVE